MALTIVTLASALGFSPPLAGADCSGPHFSVDRSEVRYDQPITVTGSGWGDNCYDTGIPEDALGLLGDPLSDISVYAIQGIDEVVVATGNADRAYAFEVDVLVPSEFALGEFEIQVDYGAGLRMEGGYGAKTIVLVEDDTGTPASEHSTPTFGPSPSISEPSVATRSQEEAAGGSNSTATAERRDKSPIPYLFAGLGLALAVVVASRTVRRRQSATRSGDYTPQ